jgi:hypothetical protein
MNRLKAASIQHDPENVTNFATAEGAIHQLDPFEWDESKNIS